MPRRTSFLTALVALTLASCGGGGTGDTDTDGSEDLDVFPGLTAPVEIIRDTYGIPHIYGDTDADVMFASGYSMASDRLFQMDLIKRRALGRQAEVLGPDKLADDELSRIVNFHGWGLVNQERLKRDDPDLYKLLVAWVAGVNKRIDEVNAGDAPLPYGFGPDELDYTPENWTLEDHMALARMYFFSNSQQLEEEFLASALRDALPEAFDAVELPRPMFDTAVLPPESRAKVTLPTTPRTEKVPVPHRPHWRGTPEQVADAVAKLRERLAGFPRTGSNNWVVDGRHTANGRPIACNDPHQPLRSPSVMYAQHLNSIDGQGQFDAIGFSFAGVAGVNLGHNRHIQWVATTNFADTSDMWSVMPGPNGGVMVGGEERDVVKRREVIKVKGEDDRVLNIEDVPGYGTIIPNSFFDLPLVASGSKVLFNWIGFRETTDESGFFDMPFAQSVAEFEAASDQVQTAGFNWMAADAEGITYHVGGLLVPDRGNLVGRTPPYTLQDGSDASTLWTDFLGPDQIPHSHADERGWIASANNDPWGFTADGDITNDPFYYGSFYAAGHRAKRIDDELTRLAEAGGITAEDMQTLQTDTYAITSDVLLPIVETTFAKVGTDPALDEWASRTDIANLVDVLTTWDRRMDRDSPGALAYHVYLMFVSTEVMSDDMPLLWGEILAAQPPFVIKLPLLAMQGLYPMSDVLVDDGVDLTIMEALDRTSLWLGSRFGGVDPSNYQWGDAHFTRFKNDFGGALDGGREPTNGGEDTVNVSSSTFFAPQSEDVLEHWDSTAGGVFRIVTEFDDDGLPVSHMNFPRGNVEDPDSEFWANTLGDWVEGNYVPLPFTRDEVTAVAHSTITLEP